MGKKPDISKFREVLHKTGGNLSKVAANSLSSSYTLQQDANKQYVLRISNPQLFWSTSKYLVIQVKK